MPNWCANRLVVEGAPEALERWLASVGGSDQAGEPLPLDFERVLPTPAEFAAGRASSTQAQELLTLYLAADPLERQRLARAQPLVAAMANNVALGQPAAEAVLWDASDWREHNWGTKWTPAAESFRLEETDPTHGRIVMRFSTAWAAPRGLLLELAQHHRELSFDLTYSETDGGFAGRLSSARGEIVADHETREPEAAIELLVDAGWPNAADDWRQPDDAEFQ
jgi:hypothetical protein